MNLGAEHWLVEQSNRNPDHTAFLSSGKKVSYSELLHKSLKASARLAKLGVQQGDHVGIFAPHNYNIFVLANSIWFIGAVPVPLNNRLTLGEIEQQLFKAQARFLIIDGSFAQDFLSIKFQNRIVSEQILSDQNNNPQTTLHTQKFNLKNIALIMFTSGSSGKQKAVVHTFNNLFCSVSALNNFAKLSNDDVWLASLPFYHIGGFMIPVRALLSGATVAFPDSPGTDDVVAALEKFQPSHISFVPTTLQRMIDRSVHPNKNLKYLFLGGGPTEKQLLSRAIENSWPVVKVYGSTETCSMAAAMNPQEVFNNPESSGKPLLNGEIRIVDEKQNETRVGNIGEILVKAGFIMKKYFDDEEETQRALQEGWYRTGDFGYMDSGGFLHVEARRDDLIISGGENIDTKEVENIIIEHEKVSDAYVFGIDDSTWGQMLCAAVVSRNLSDNELKTYMKQKIAAYKIPKQIYFVDEIPRNEMSKVDKKKLFEKIKLC